LPMKPGLLEPDIRSAAARAHRNLPSIHSMTACHCARVSSRDFPSFTFTSMASRTIKALFTIPSNRPIRTMGVQSLYTSLSRGIGDVTARRDPQSASQRSPDRSASFLSNRARFCGLFGEVRRKRAADTASAPSQAHFPSHNHVLHAWLFVS